MCTRGLHMTAGASAKTQLKAIGKVLLLFVSQCCVHGGFKGCEEKKPGFKLKINSGKRSPRSATTQKAPVTVFIQVWAFGFGPPWTHFPPAREHRLLGLIFFGSTHQIQHYV